jgi:hypothetical protein
MRPFFKATITIVPANLTVAPGADLDQIKRIISKGTRFLVNRYTVKLALAFIPVLSLIIGSALSSRSLPPVTENKPPEENSPETAAASASANAAVFVPAPEPVTNASPHSIHWGIYINGVPHDMAKLEAFENLVKKNVSIVHWGQPWMRGGEYQKLQTSALDDVRDHGAIPMVNWGSWDFEMANVQPDFQLRDIYEGQHDAYIRQWAREAKSWGRPFFLRFDHEMNGWWYPWSEETNGNQRGEFVLAWRHVHDIFTEVGATNVYWVWCINHIDPSRPVDGFYPGDEYVDWVGMDRFNGGTYNEWMPFYALFKPTYDVLVKLAPSKPVMVAEFASSEKGEMTGDPVTKADWIRDALSEQLQVYFPHIRAVVWFNWGADEADHDWEVESSPESIQAFSEAINSPYFPSNGFWCLRESPLSALDSLPLPPALTMPEKFKSFLFLPVTPNAGSTAEDSC